MTGLSEQLTFVTDEQMLPSETGKVVCDLLALRTVREGAVPVVIELKSRRDMARLIAQLNTMAAIVDAHRARFAQLFAALLGHDVRLVGPCERWLVWPAAPQDTDPRLAELAQRGIVAKGHRMHVDGYTIA